MSKKVLILSGSPRNGGNSDLLCDEFMRGAIESGNEVQKIRVASKKVAPCRACYYCRLSGGKCAIEDDMGEILQKMIDADVIVLASPVYFYSIDAQLKAVIDRTVARWLEVKNKEFYYIVTMADEELESADTTLACFRGYADCVQGAKEMGVIIGSGVYEKGTVKDTTAMTEAYEMGRNV
ncbi:MAG: flavodoxin family protein [Faecalibacterium sp.]|nr:flavodoxin family protein [Ruminococcus sp.]MCM1392975.1 flavodoxin family protein [Ruminococcus sp.]MCM1484669.1 flavodoxin family protein [Faecalibacterium sp.]